MVSPPRHQNGDLPVSREVLFHRGPRQLRPGAVLAFTPVDGGRGGRKNSWIGRKGSGVKISLGLYWAVDRKNKQESVPESEGQRASVQSGSGLGRAQPCGLRLSAGPLSILLQGPPTAGDTAPAQRLWATRLDQIQCVHGAEQQEAGGPRLGLLHPPRPPPDGLNGQDHASVKTHKTQVGVWEERASGVQRECTVQRR